MTTSDRVLKRTFDFLFAVGGLICLSPLMVIAWIVASVETRSNGLYRQTRVGRHGSLFSIAKIKTMRDSSGKNTTITTATDKRITASGAFFRKFKIDELPQLWNIVLGEMSFVGPRPDVPGYADKLTAEDALVTSVRPGITGPASLKYRNEEEILAAQSDPEKYNDEVIWPDKVKVNKDYIKNYSFVQDIRFILITLKG